MSLDYALPKKFPHKLALIDVQFFFGKCQHTLFTARSVRVAPLNVKKKEVQTLFPLLAKW